MLIKEAIKPVNFTRTVMVMSDTDILAATIKSTLSEIAKQASALGVGLQNAAPGDKPNHSVQYLLSIADELSKLANDGSSPSSGSSKENR